VLIVNAHGDDPTYGETERAVSELTEGLALVGAQVGYLQAFPQRIRGHEVERTVLNRFDWRDHAVGRLRTHVASALSGRRLRIAGDGRLRDEVARAGAAGDERRVGRFGHGGGKAPSLRRV
jgi:hypothetical protein